MLPLLLIGHDFVSRADSGNTGAGGVTGWGRRGGRMGRGCWAFSGGRGFELRSRLPGFFHPSARVKEGEPVTHPTQILPTGDKFDVVRPESS